MQKIHYELLGRARAVKNRAEKYAAHDPQGAYKSALNHQVKYGRKGYIRYDSANTYNDAGDLQLYDLAAFDPVPLQDISRRAYDYTGYYADNFQCELVSPYIVKIKTSRGLFICPAVAYSDSDQATIYFSRGQFAPRDENNSEYESAIHEAARIADSIAERLGEEGRDADAQFQAEQQRDDLIDQIKDTRAAARVLIAAIRAQRKAGSIQGAICDALIQKLHDYKREIIHARERIAALNSDYWQAVY